MLQPIQVRVKLSKVSECGWVLLRVVNSFLFMRRLQELHSINRFFAGAGNHKHSTNKELTDFKPAERRN